MKYLLFALPVILLGCILDPDKKPVVHNTVVECKADTVMIVDSLGYVSQRLCTYSDIKPGPVPQ